MSIALSNPTIVEIPLTQLLPNPRQPRRRFRPGSIQAMAESLRALGQETPLKVRPLTAEEKAANPGFEYLIIGGHRRRAGAELAGLPNLDCMILPLTPAETHLASVMDNNQEEMDWWDWDLAIEEESKATGLSQRKLADRMEVSQPKVNNALKVLKAL
ncbi:MAG TPA: ParB/RepB/Spo0J family partition protein, partial [bacterium]|nr:ParB/RepB/Spo0J family partition protein [bacterium]